MIVNVWLKNNWRCSSCGWPVIDCLTNDEMHDFVKSKDDIADYYAYCSNKGCKNHDGEGFEQCIPEWIIEVNNEQKD